MRIKTEVFLYLVYGLLTTLINVLAFKFFISLSLNYSISTIIAFIISVLFAFYTNSKFVFNMKAIKKKKLFYLFLGFLTSRIFTLLVDLLSMVILIELFRFNELLSKLLSNFLVVLLNYILSKFIVFNKDVEN